MTIYLILSTVLLISFVTDIKERKILNIVTFPAILFGLIYHSILNGMSGIAYSGLGFLLGFGLLLVPFLLGGMGAGDVKLMAAIGALTGMNFTLQAFVFIALIGGGISILLIIKQKGLINSVRSSIYMIPFLRSNIGSNIIKKTITLAFHSPMVSQLF